MEYAAVEIVLNNGYPAILKSPAADEAKEVVELLQTTSYESDYLLCYGEERNMTVKEEMDYLKAVNASPFDLLVCCYAENAMVGFASLGIRKQLKVRHRGEVGIAVLRTYQHLGIGQKLMTVIENTARSCGVCQLELSCFADNALALKMYAKLGYKEVGRIPDAFHLKDGGSGAEVIMVKTL